MPAFLRLRSEGLPALVRACTRLQRRDVREQRSFAQWGSISFPWPTHGLRRRLYSVAPSRLERAGL